MGYANRRDPHLVPVQQDIPVLISFKIRLAGVELSKCVTAYETAMSVRVEVDRKPPSQRDLAQQPERRELVGAGRHCALHGAHHAERSLEAFEQRALPASEGVEEDVQTWRTLTIIIPA